MDRRATLLSIMLPPLVAAGFVLGFYTAQARMNRTSELDPSQKVREVALHVEKRFYGKISADKLEHGAVDGMLKELDPYCQYFNAAEWKDFNETTIDGKFGGVGILIDGTPDGGYHRVLSPIEGSPAFDKDIIPGDVMTEIDGKSVKDLPLDDLRQRIRGTLGSKVAITFVRDGGKPFVIDLVRAEISSPIVRGKMLESGFGYVRVTDFTKMMDQFDAAVAKLKAAGATGLVIDLRFNRGGLVKSAVELSDRFLPAGKVVMKQKGRLPEDNHEYLTKDDAHDVGDLPAVVLVNGDSASASEIFAGALRDHGRARMVGARTWGKGMVQMPMELSDGSRVKLTTAHYYTPAGTDVQREPGKREFGFEPDYLVEMTDAEYGAVRRRWMEEDVLKRPASKPLPPNTAVDFQLNAAVEVLKAELAHREPKVERRELATLPK